MRGAWLIVVAGCGKIGFTAIATGDYARPSAIYVYNDVAPAKTVAIAGNAPLDVAGLTHFAIEPDLEAATGLAFDSTTGVIAGLPTKTSPSTRYAVTAWNDGDREWRAAITIRTAPGFYVTSQSDDQDATPADDDCVTAAGTCSLRAAVKQLELFDRTIRVALLPEGTITMSGGDIYVTNPLELIGAGQGASVIDANHVSRAIDAGIENTLIASDVTLRNGQTVGDGGCLIAEGGSVTLTRVAFEDCSAGAGGGAAWLSDNYGTYLMHIAITQCTFMRNRADIGGALLLEDLYPGSSLTIAGSEFSNNTATTSGGAIDDGGGPLAITESLFESNGGPGFCAVYFEDPVVATLTNDTFIANTNMAVCTNNGANVTLINDTIAGNTCNPGCFGGAGVSQNSGGTLGLRNTIVANNIDLSDNTRSNFRAAGTMISLGHNLTDSLDGELPFATAAGDLVSTEPRLGALADNGGPTRTAAIAQGSPAYNAGTNTECPATDQRGSGYPRPAGGICDIGAFEVEVLRSTRAADRAVGQFR